MGRMIRKILVYIMAVVLVGTVVFAGCDSFNLGDYKKTAKGLIDAHVATKAEADYSEDKWAELLNAAAEGKQAVDEAINKDEVDAVVIDAKVAMNCVENMAVSLGYHKITANALIDAHITTKDETYYYPAKWTKLLSLAAEGKQEVENASSKDEVDSVVYGTKTAIDNIEKYRMSFNAVMHDRAISWGDEEFCMNNLTSHVSGLAYYENRDGVTFYVDGIQPLSRTFIIRNQEEYENIFKHTTLSMHFESQMLLLFIFSQTANGLSYGINKVCLDNRTLTVHYELHETTQAPWASSPRVRWLVVKLNKLDIDAAEFVRAPNCIMY